jgi:hypothetical protein
MASTFLLPESPLLSPASISMIIPHTGQYHTITESED